MTHPKQSAVKPLIEGYRKFKKAYFEDSTVFEPLVTEGQKPNVLMISCCDSRVEPATMLGTEPGDLFIVRNVANLVPPYESDLRHHGTSAAIEFAVLGLNVTDIIVMGHHQCGGIKALLKGSEDSAETDFIAPWMNIAKAAKKTVLENFSSESTEEQLHQCEKASLRISMANLCTFPWIQERIDQGELFLHAWYFDMANGVVEALDEGSDTFVPL